MAKQKKKPRLPPYGMVPSLSAKDPYLTKTDLRVLIALCARRNKNTKLCCPSIDLLADDTGIHRDHIKKSRRHLKKRGWINWTQESAGRYSSCHYEIFGLDGKNPMGAGSDLMGAKAAPLNGGENSPPNIEGNIESNNIPIKHSASSVDDGEYLVDKDVYKEELSFHQQASIFESRIKNKKEVTATDLKELKALRFEAEENGSMEEAGHVTRVYEDAINAAPEELNYIWEDDF